MCIFAPIIRRRAYKDWDPSYSVSNSSNQSTERLSCFLPGDESKHTVDVPKDEYGNFLKIQCLLNPTRYHEFSIDEHSLLGRCGEPYCRRTLQFFRESVRPDTPPKSEVRPPEINEPVRVKVSKIGKESMDTCRTSKPPPAPVKLEKIKAQAEMTTVPETTEIERIAEGDLKRGPTAEPKPSQAAPEVEDHTEPELGASPQAEDGHIDIANELAEAFRRVNLSSYEWRILWAILRETYGWHRKMAPISLTDFQKATGLDRSNISKTLSKLIGRRIIRKGIETKKKFRRYSGDSDNTNSITYGPQKDYLKWKGSGYSYPPVAVHTTKRVAVHTTDVDRKPMGEKGKRVRKERKERIHVKGDSESLRLATLFLGEILKNKPDFRKPNLGAWARDFDYMLRIDKRDAGTVERVIRWAQSDHGDGMGKWKGWAAVILSAGKLRDKFDQLEIKMNETPPTEKGKAW